MPTQMAGFRGIGRIDQHDRDARSLRLVGHKLPQLIERPTVVVVALRFADFRPLPDAFEVFEGNLTLGSLSLLDKLFTDRVVNRAHMTCLFAGQPFQKPFGFFRAFALERAPDFRVVGTQTVHLCGFVGPCIGIDRHTPPAKIDTQRARGCLRDRGRTFELDVQEEHAITPLDQRRTRRCVALEPSFLVVAKRGLNPLSAVQERQTEGPIPLAEAEDALIVVNRRGFKRRMGLALDLQCRTDTRNGTNGKVRRQTKAVPHVLIAGMLDLDFVARMDGASHLSDAVARVRKRGKRRVDFSALFLGWHELAGQRSYGVHRECYRIPRKTPPLRAGI